MTLQGADAFGFDMILDIYTLMLPEHQREKGNKVFAFCCRTHSEDLVLLV